MVCFLSILKTAKKVVKASKWYISNSNLTVLWIFSDLPSSGCDIGWLLNCNRGCFAWYWFDMKSLMWIKAWCNDRVFDEESCISNSGKVNRPGFFRPPASSLRNAFQTLLVKVDCWNHGGVLCCRIFRCNRIHHYWHLPAWCRFSAWPVPALEVGKSSRPRRYYGSCLGGSCWQPNCLPSKSCANLNCCTGPWSEWTITSCFGLRLQTAINNASIAKSLVICAFIDQPTTWRENRSSTTAKYSVSAP